MLFALGFVFMFTIGGLITTHLALPLKTTICWELLTIILLEISLILVTMYNFEQSAGNRIPHGIKIERNILVGTSETTRCPRSTLRVDIVQVKKYSLRRSLNSLNFVKTGQPTSSGRMVITRSYSNFSNKQQVGNKYMIQNLNAVKVYDNFKEDRVNILKEQRDKSGVYCLINKVNGHSYVGSSMNLASRMRNYLNKTFLKSKQNANMPITKALLKYDYSNFSFLILEYAGIENLTGRETFYITQMIPHYNVLKEGYSSLGYKHTEETKKLLSELANNRTHSEKTKGLIARAVVGENNPFYNKSHSVESKRRMIEANSAYSVYVYNSFKELLVIFPSVLTLTKLIKSNHPTLVSVIKEGTIFRGE
jgi:group I intron endonuclease